MDFGPNRDRMPAIQISAAALIRHRDEKTVLAFMLINGQTLTGRVLWFDDSSFHIKASDESETTLLKHAVLYYRPA